MTLSGIEPATFRLVAYCVNMTSALYGSEWSASRTCRFTPEEGASGAQWIGGWVDPRTDLEDVKRRKYLATPRHELGPLGRPARSQSLYRLRYRCSS
jgi:hypothetical protein